MFSQFQLENILFLDIETASIVPTHDDLPEKMQELWAKKSRRYQKNGEPDPVTLYGEKAGIHAEFGRVVCISCGYLKFQDGQPEMVMKSYYGEDERQILEDFGKMLDDYRIDKFGKEHGARTLCAHNGKEFDFPYLGRRFLIHGLALPAFLQLQGKKPWEIKLLDSMELWKFGDYKAYTSLELMATVLGIPSPKDDIDGSQVSRVFWDDKDHERIKIYCEKDVKTTAQVLLRMSRFPLVKD